MSYLTVTPYNATEIRRNWVTNPRAVQTREPGYGEIGFWTNRAFGANGAGTYSWIQNASDGPAGTGITTYLRKQWTTAPTVNNDAGFDHTSPITEGGFYVQGGEWYTFSVYLRPNVSGKLADIVFTWTDYDEVGLGQSTSTSTGHALPANVWTRLSFTVQAPAGAFTAKIWTDIDHFTGTTLWAVGNRLDATGAMMQVGEQVLAQYFDGNTLPATEVESYEWAGFENEGPSVYRIVNESVTGAPFAEVLVDTFEEEVDHFTAWRTVKGRRFQVRGMVETKAGIAGAVTIRDYECPIGVEATYQVEQFTAGGVSLGWTAPATVILTGLEPGYAWFHDPLDPSTSIKVKTLQGFGRNLTRPNSSNITQVPTRSLGIRMPGTRRGVEGVVLDVLTETREDGEQLDALFGRYDSDALSIVCVRARPETWLPPTLFAFVAAPNMQVLGNDGETVKWGMTGDETIPPTAAVVTALLTYQDFADFYGSYSQFAASYPSYLQASRDYSIEGTP